MLCVIKLLCLVAAPVLATTKTGLEVKFDGNVSRIGITAYYDVPQSQFGRQSSRSEGPAEMYSAVMWCPRDGRSACVLTDDSGNIVGTQTALDANLYSDWKARGFTDWPIKINGVTKNYWPAQQYKVKSACSVAVTPTVQATYTPTTTRKPDSVLQDSGILVSSLSGEQPPSSITTNIRDVNSDKPDVNNQACVKMGTYERGLVARFDDGESTVIGRTAYFNLPQSQFEAAAVGWVQTTRPEGPPEMSSLLMWCPRDDRSVCVFTDDTGYIAGTQTALDVDRFENAILDWKTQGFTYWSTQVNGVTKNYWTAQQYYVTPALLATDPETRIARRKSDTILQDSAVLVSGFNGQLYSISTNACDFISGKTNFTEQACVDKMGVHYAYKISNATRCSDDQILPWLSLIHNNQLVGVTLVMYSKHTTPEEGRHWFEILDHALLKVALPNGPDCLYDLPDKSGLVTLHTYFIKRPYDIKC